MIFRAAVIALALIPITASADVSRARYLMGTVCEISIDGEASQIERAFAEAARVEAFLSTWRDDSELSSLNRNGGAEVSPELYALLRDVVTLGETSGTFNPLMRPLIDAWKTRGSGSLPSPAVLADAMRRIDPANVRFVAPSRIELHNGAQFEEGGFGKGYAIDRMLAVTKARRAVINFGGQIGVRGESRLSIADPERRQVPAVSVTVRDGSLSTSSGSEKSFTIGGRRFTHIVDPRSGEALPPRGSASVIARDALTADVLSTALYVMGPEQGLRWANAHGVAALFITASHQIVRSENFPKD